jgi:ribosomal protein S18 acetylase RimI-like enzyme
MSVHLEALHESYFERLYQLFDSVCRERRFLAFTQAGPREQTFSYYRSILDAGGIHFVAVSGTQLVGWCDVLPLIGQMRAHSSVLGMAVAADFRGQGIGRQLITTALQKADERGFKRVELTVHTENTSAQALYKSVGFEFEGTQRRGWCLDGQFFDIHYMARLA